MIHDPDRAVGGTGHNAAQLILGHRAALQHGFAWWRAFSEALLGRLAIKPGAPNADGIAQIRKGIAEWQAMGMRLASDFLMLLLADACLAAAGLCPRRDQAQRADLLASGLASVEAALGPAKVACGQTYEAELRRLRGELLLARAGLAAAEEALACFRRALEVGRAQGALAWELRAAASVVRLRERQGDAYAAGLAEARRGLRDVYERFSDDTREVDGE